MGGCTRSSHWARAGGALARRGPVRGRAGRANAYETASDTLCRRRRLWIQTSRRNCSELVVTSRPPVPMLTSPRLTSTTRPLHAVKGVSPCVSCGALRWPIGYEEREKPDVGKSQSYVARSRPCEGASPDGGTARGDGGTGQRAPPRELLSQLNTLKSDAHGT